MSAIPGDDDRRVLDRPRLVALRNGEKLPSTFSREEMDRRLSGLRAWMREASVDACLFTSIHNVNYFADYVYCSFGRHYGLVVTHDAHTIIGANLDYGRPGRRSFAASLAYTDWHADNFFVAVRSLCPERGRIGIELDHLTCAAREKLEAALPGVELVDAGEATMRMRMIKSAEEHALIRDGAAIADIGGAAGVEAIADRAPEHEVALHATAAMVREIARRYPHVELMDTWSWFQSGINTDGAHNPVTTRKVAPGDILSLNCFPMIAGYYHALERTLFYRHVPDEQHAPWQVNCEVHRRGIEIIRPGVRCMDIAHELNAIYAEHGLLDRRTFGYGHSFGTLSHYYGREAGLEFREDVETVLVPGMVVSMEPMVTLPQGVPGGADHILTEKSTSYGEFSAVIRHFVRKVVPMCPASRSVPYRTPAFTDPSTPEMLSLRPAPGARCRRIPRARHAHRHRGRGREPHRISVRPRAQRGRSLTRTCHEAQECPIGRHNSPNSRSVRCAGTTSRVIWPDPSSTPYRAPSSMRRCRTSGPSSCSTDDVRGAPVTSTGSMAARERRSAWRHAADRAPRGFPGGIGIGHHPDARRQRRVRRVRAVAAPGARIVADGDVIDLGDRQFEVLHTPGHSPGGVALWEADTGILFSGDIVYDGPLIEDAYHSSPRDYHLSMKRLHDLPVRVVHGGHFPSYDGQRHRGIVRRWLDEKERT